MQGFVGKATYDDKCRCNMKLYWENGKPYCTFLEIGVAGNTLFNKQKPWLNSIKALYNMTIFPNNELYINGLQVPDVLEEDVKGEILEYWPFRNKMEVADYFIGMTPNRITSIESPIAVGVGFQVTQFTIDVDQNKAYSMVNMNLGSIYNNSIIYLNVTQFGIWRFSDNDKIQEIMIMDPFCSEMLRLNGYGFNKDKDINDTCNLHNKHCTGSNQQYKDHKSCRNFLESIPYGNPDSLTTNTTLCRLYRSKLLILRPEYYCPQIGPDGANTCVDRLFTDHHKISFFPPNVGNRLFGSLKRY